jgi:hypothetical protein
MHDWAFGVGYGYRKPKLSTDLLHARLTVCGFEKQPRVGSMCKETMCAHENSGEPPVRVEVDDGLRLLVDTP